MYIVGIVIGIVATIVGINTDPVNASQREWLTGLGVAIILISLYAWYRGLGPSGRDTPDSPGPSTGFRFEMMDTIAILVIGAVCVIGAMLIL